MRVYFNGRTAASQAVSHAFPPFPMSPFFIKNPVSFLPAWAPYLNMPLPHGTCDFRAKACQNARDSENWEATQSPPKTGPLFQISLTREKDRSQMVCHPVARRSLRAKASQSRSSQPNHKPSPSRDKACSCYPGNQATDWHDLFYEHEGRDRGDPQHVHNAADKQKRHQCPTAADAISAMT
jgi:hypothetical protein